MTVNRRPRRWVTLLTTPPVILAGIACGGALWVLLGRIGTFTALGAAAGLWLTYGLCALLRRPGGKARAAAAILAGVLAVLLGTLGSLAHSAWDSYEGSLSAAYDEAMDEAVSAYAEPLQKAARKRLTEANPRQQYIAELKASLPQDRFTLQYMPECWQDAGIRSRLIREMLIGLGMVCLCGIVLLLPGKSPGNGAEADADNP